MGRSSFYACCAAPKQHLKDDLSQNNEDECVHTGGGDALVRHCETSSTESTRSESSRELVDEQDTGMPEEDNSFQVFGQVALLNGKKHGALQNNIFRSWKEFLESDLDLKHRTPITLGEFELLLQKETESLKNWDLCIDHPTIKVVKQQTGSTGFTLRAWAKLRGVELHVAFLLMFDVEHRRQWDMAFDRLQIVGDGHGGCEVLYSSLRLPKPICPRDFLQYRRVLELEDGSILIVLRSAEHPEAPEEPRCIRAESHISGYVLRQTFDTRTGAPTCDIFLMSSSDVKGMIPKILVECLAPKKPKEWVDALQKAAMDYQRKNADYKEALHAMVKHHSTYLEYDFEPKT